LAKRPAGQTEQASLPVSLVKVPMAHLVQEVEPEASA